MVDKNAKAPKVRSGDEINPLMAKIIKIVAMVVIAALIVVITLVVVEFINRSKVKESAFKDQNHLILSDYKTITNPNSDFNLINDSKIKDIVTETVDSDNKLIYFYFYYGSLVTDINNEQLEIIRKLDKDKAQIFFVDLESDAPKEDAEQTQERYLDYLSSTKNLNPAKNNIEIEATLTSKVEGKLRHVSFIITFDVTKNDNLNNPFEIVRGNDNLKTILSKLPVSE